jgi:uncharacterized protein (UPF0218 family)
MSGFVYQLRQKDIPELKKAHGPSFETAKELLANASRPLIVVGDRASYNILKEGGKPDLVIHDDHEQRKLVQKEMFDEIYLFPAAELVVENPKSTITKDLWDAVGYALKRLPHRIRVIGEEDLAVVAVSIQAPIGSSIAYGFEKKIVLAKVTKGLKDLMSKMVNPSGAP